MARGGGAAGPLIREPPHPRDTFDFEGGEAVEAAFLEAIARRRLHHAWLLVGPEGVGKATFAYRAARRLLGARPDAAHGALGASPDDRVSRLIASRSHPDLMVLQREGEDGKARKQIPVDEARELPEFFAKTPAVAAWRVAIVDAADDLNPSSANALLKTLEEPSERGVILLVCHRPEALLPTIRSRCRILRFAAPAPARTVAWLEARSGVSAEEVLRAAEMAGGAPGRAWRLAAAGALALDAAARELIAAPGRDPASELAMAESFRGAAGAERFAILMTRLAAQVREKATGRALAGEGEGLDALAETHALLVELAARTEAVNLDRADAFYTALERLKAVAC